MGQLLNGVLVETGESTGFDVFVTTDKNLKYQHNLSGRQIAILVLWTTSWPELQPHAPAIVLAVAQLRAGEYRELDRPA